MISKVGRFVDDDYKAMCWKWSPWRSMQLCTLFSKLQITLLHVAAEISLMMFSTLRFRSLMHFGLFLYTFSCNIPKGKKSSGFRSGDRCAWFSSIDFSSLWMFSDVRTDFGLSVSSWLQIAPVPLNLLTTFIIHLRDGAHLTLKYFLNILCVARTELEAINSSNILTSSSVICRWFSILAEFDTNFWIILYKKIGNLFQDWYP